MTKEATKTLDKDGGKEAKQERHEGAGHATGGAVEGRQKQAETPKDGDTPKGPMFADTEHHNDPVDPRTGLRGRPESPSDHFGQRTRDNVNPAIPSSPPGTGGIVDPASLGMEQGGVAPHYYPDEVPVRSINEPGAPMGQSPQDPSTHEAGAAQQQQWPYVGVDPLHPLNVPQSINEPPGSDITGGGGEGGGTPDPVTLTGVTPATGVIGADVPIPAEGTGFTEASVISFGGTALATTYGSASSLNATAPGVAAAEGPVDVTVDGSAPVTFTWALVAGDDPDDMEAELEDAEDDGDYVTSKKGGKRKR
jgi:hypothetical protein